MSFAAGSVTRRGRGQLQSGAPVSREMLGDELELRRRPAPGELGASPHAEGGLRGVVQPRRGGAP